jgi:orotate phosphoribosyltransferase
LTGLRSWQALQRLTLDHNYLSIRFSFRTQHGDVALDSRFRGNDGKEKSLVSRIRENGGKDHCFGFLREHQKGVSGQMNMKEELIELLCRKAFQYNPEPVFKLVAGGTSRFYVNCRPVTLSPRGMFLAGHLFFEAVAALNPAGIGGLTFGADPISVATAFVSELKGQPIQAFSIRKAQKDHGIVKWIEGDLRRGDRVVVIDDVATTGGSTIKAIERARQEGLEVVKALVLVDRQEGGMENIRRHVADAEALISRDELMACYAGESRRD